MLKESLHIYTLDSDGNKTPFPSAQYPAILSEWTYTAERMASAPTITGSFMHKQCLDDLWTKKEFVEFCGERYYVTQVPTSSKDTEDVRYKHEVALTSERIVLENVYFLDVVTSETDEQYKDRYRSNGTTFSFYGTLHELVSRLNDSLIYSSLYDPQTGTGYRIVIDEGIDVEETKEISLENTYIVTALQEIYNQFGVPYYWVGETCHVGYSSNLIATPFEYGQGKGLLSVEKANANYRIIDRITGMGSSDNIPYYYPNATPDGTAIFHSIGITEDKVRAVSLSKIMKYNTGMSGWYRYCFQGDKETSVSTELSIKRTWYKFCPNNSGDVITEWNTGGVYIDGEANVTLESYGKHAWAQLFAQYIIYGKKNCTISTAQLAHLTVKGFSYRESRKRNIFCLNKVSDPDELPEILFSNYPTTGYVAMKESDSFSYTFMEDGYYVLTQSLYWRFKTNGRLEVYFYSYDRKFQYKFFNPDKYFFQYGEGRLNDAGDDVIYNDTPKEIAYEDSGITFEPNANIPTAVYEWHYSHWAGGGSPHVFRGWASGNPAIIAITDREWIPPSQNLMPSIYRESKGGERFYNAENGRYTIPDDPDGTTYSFNNIYIKGEQHEFEVSFDSIKPTIEGVKNASGQLFGEIADIAFDKEDSDVVDDTGDGEYLHSYFYIKLHVFDGPNGFNLFHQALESGTATINMTSGNCAACAFEIAVEKESTGDGTSFYFKNPVMTDDAGNLAEANDKNLGDYIEKDKSKWMSRQQDTRENEVWIAVKKDNNTFGIVMPNVNQNYRPAAGDTFVITNISMPDSLVLAAEHRLEDELIRYMKENNDEKFNFSVTFSRMYLQQNPDIAAMLDENARLIVRYDGHEYTLYVSSFTCKASDDILNEITVEITDEFTVGQSVLRDKITEITQSVISGTKSLDYVAVGQKHFLSKRQNDTAQGLITFLSGILTDNIHSRTFLSGADGSGFILKNNASTGKSDMEIDELLVRTLANIATAIVGQIGSEKFVDGFFGEGYQIWKAIATGDWNFTIDRLTVRKMMTVYELLIQKMRAVGGQLVVSAGNGKIKEVSTDEFGENYLIMFEDDNTFAAGDLMRCQVWTGVETKHYWVRVTSSDGNTITVPVSEFEGAQPAQGDECVLMGNTDNPLRQNLISISATEDGQPRVDVLNGVKEKNFDGCLRARLGNLDGISDSWFPADNQPHGDGLYADNAYLRGTFLLVTGEDIKTKFEITEGKIQSAVEGLREEFTGEKSYLDNASFTSGLDKWSTENDTVFFIAGNKWIWANGSVLSKKGDGAYAVTDMERTVVRIMNKYILQRHGNLRIIPAMGTDGDGNKTAIPVYLSFLYRCAEAGTLKVSFDNVDKTGFADFDSMEIEEELDVTEGYVQYTCDGLWNGTGDFRLEFDGDIYLYMLMLSTDKTEALAYKYKTLFEQSEKLVRIAAENFDKDGNVLESSGIVTTSKYNALISERFNDDGTLKNTAGLVTTTDLGGVLEDYVKVTSFAGLFAAAVSEDGNIVKKADITAFVTEDDVNGIVSNINLGADKITLEGLVTANGNFKILEDGSMEAANATVSGNFISFDEPRGNSIVINAQEGYMKMRGPELVMDDDRDKPASENRIDLFELLFETDSDSLSRIATMYLRGDRHEIRIDPIDGIWLTDLLGYRCLISSDKIEFYDNKGNILRTL